MNHLECRVVPCAIEDRPFIFISYSHDDAHYVFPVLEGVAAAGYNIWYDHGIEIHATWSDELANAITASSLVVVFISKNAMASHYVRTEVEFALSKNVKVLPVYLEGTGVLPPGLSLMLHTTQGILSNDTDVIASKLFKWLTQNFAQTRESRMPATSPSVSAEPVLPTKNQPTLHDWYLRKSGRRL